MSDKADKRRSLLTLNFHEGKSLGLHKFHCPTNEAVVSNIAQNNTIKYMYLNKTDSFENQDFKYQTIKSILMCLANIRSYQ